MGAAVAVVAVRAGTELIPRSLGRAPSRRRFMLYLLLGAGAAATVGPWLVLVLVGSGLAEVFRSRSGGSRHLGVHVWPLVAVVAVGTGGVTALAWVALKVGALSYGGGFVIIPLMQGDAVGRYHWMTDAQFLNAVALGQVTPGPVVLTVAVVGCAAAGLAGGVLAAFVAFLPSFTFVLAGARHFDQLRANPLARAFLAGAGPAAIGAILGAAVPLALALGEPWQLAVLGAAAIALLALRRGVVVTLLGAALSGLVAAQLGAPLP
jgi:chromate transporter